MSRRRRRTWQCPVSLKERCTLRRCTGDKAQDRPRQNVDQGISHTATAHGRRVSNRSAVHDSGNYRWLINCTDSRRGKSAVSAFYYGIYLYISRVSSANLGKIFQRFGRLSRNVAGIEEGVFFSNFSTKFYPLLFYSFAFSCDSKLYAELHRILHASIIYCNKWNISVNYNDYLIKIMVT